MVSTRNARRIKVIDKVFQNYLEYNDSDEEVRDLYLEIKNK